MKELDSMFKMFVIVAHPDDEIGCGGTMAKYSEEYEISCLILGEGEMSRDGASYDVVADLKRQSRKAARILGIKNLSFKDFPDNSFDSGPMLSIVKAIERWVGALGPPDYVFTHFQRDLNVDHQMTSQAVQTVFRPEAFPDCKGLFFFEMPSSTDRFCSERLFRPTMYVDIEDTLPMKLQAFECYEGEAKGPPHPRSVKGMLDLAGYRGSCIGFSAAEAFEIGYVKGFL